MTTTEKVKLGLGLVAVIVALALGMTVDSQADFWIRLLGW